MNMKPSSIALRRRSRSRLPPRRKPTTLRAQGRGRPHRAGEGRQGQVREPVRQRAGRLPGRGEGQGEDRQGRAERQVRQVGARPAQRRGHQGRGSVRSREAALRRQERPGEGRVHGAGQGHPREGQGADPGAVRSAQGQHRGYRQHVRETEASVGRWPELSSPTWRRAAALPRRPRRRPAAADRGCSRNRASARLPMARGLWKGAISFGLVNVPVELHSAKRARASSI